MISSWHMTAEFVHFSGDWDEEHRQAVAEATAIFERKKGGVILPPGWKPWVCICRRVNSVPYFSASRVGMPEIIIAATVDELTEKIASVP
jgi:hypothetical protein